MASDALSDYENVNVTSFQGLLVDYAFENDIGIIIKGVRNSSDFDYENLLHEVSRSQDLGIDTHVLFAHPELSHVSSSAAKEIQKEHGDVHKYVPLNVKQYLEARISGQYVVGVTGKMGAGKSYVGEKFVEFGKEKDIEVHNIELDRIGHEILEGLEEPMYKKVRNQIVNTFGSEVRGEDDKIDRERLGEIVFDDSYSLEKLNKIMRTPLLVRLRKELYNKKGLILLNSALITEWDVLYLCNNNVVMVGADEESQRARFYSGNLSYDQIKKRMESQFDFTKKKEMVEESINTDKHGDLWEVDNSNGSIESLENVFEDVVRRLDVYELYN